jgi:WD repeat-containing protein 90
VSRCKGSADSSTADICVWDLSTGSCSKVLSYHAVAVQAMAFSSDGAWLVSLGRDPERSVVIWDVRRGEAVAVGRTEQAVCAVAWCCHAATPSFVTAGGDGALLWSLEPTHLSQRTLSLPPVRAFLSNSKPRLSIAYNQQCAYARSYFIIQQ